MLITTFGMIFLAEEPADSFDGQFTTTKETYQQILMILMLKPVRTLLKCIIIFSAILPCVLYGGLWLLKMQDRLV